MTTTINNNLRVYQVITSVGHQVFCNIDESIMDEKPFMVFDFMNIEQPLIPELKKLCNDCFDVNVALAAAQELKYLRQLKKIIEEEVPFNFADYNYIDSID